MNILQIIPSYLPSTLYGGPILATDNLCKALVARGHRVTVYTTDVNGNKKLNVPLAKPVKRDGYEVVYFRARFFKNFCFAPLMKKTLIKNIRKYDVLHLHSLFLWPTSMAAKIAKKHNIPYLIAPRGMLIQSLIQGKNCLLKMLWIYFFDKKTMEQARCIHVTSKLELKEIQKFSIKYQKIQIIPNGVQGIDCDDTSVSLDPAIQEICKKKKYILFLGRICWEKGLDRLIPAFKYVHSHSLVIAGNDEGGYQQKMATLAKKEGVSEKIIYAGYVDLSNKVTLLKNAEILVLASYSENFGNVVTEAMAAGCPVIVTREVGLAERIEETKSGLVTEGDSVSLAKAINALIADPNQRAIMGRNGKMTVERDFKWECIAQQMENVYQDVLKIEAEAV